MPEWHQQIKLLVFGFKNNARNPVIARRGATKQSDTAGVILSVCEGSILTEKIPRFTRDDALHRITSRSPAMTN